MADLVLLLVWAGGMSLDDGDCEAAERRPDRTAEDWVCTGFLQEVGPYAIVPLVITLGLTLLSVVRAARRTKRPA